jgi:serine protease Do
MTNRLETRILLVSILFLLPVTAGLATYVLLQAREDSYLSTSASGYTPPKYLGGIVQFVQESLVTVQCTGNSGSGFSFGLDATDMNNGLEYRSEDSESAAATIVTNFHVIDACLDKSDISVIAFDDSKHSARILEVDEVNDLAMLGIDHEIPVLYGAGWKPSPGYWTMALGSPHSFAGSVTYGNIINLDQNLVFHTASLSPGNSGGPLVDNEGYLYGVNTGSKPVGQNFNISVGVNAFCDVLINCTKSRYWADK